MNEYLQINKLEKSYKSSSYKSPLIALDQVDLKINKFEIVGLIGESGSGKSTLGKCILGLEKQTKGEILIEGISNQELIKSDRVKFYRKNQMIFQNPYEVFDYRYKVRQILEDGLKIHKLGNSKSERTEIINQMLEEASLYPPEEFIERYPKELSGGQIQRISIIRSMMLRPKFLVADEPVTMLDVSIRADIINLLIKMREKYKIAILFISHDIATTSFISDRIAVMYLGQIVEEASTKELIQKPLHPYTQALLSNSKTIHENKNEAIKLIGDPPKPINLGEKCYFSNRCFKACDRCFKEKPELMDVEGNRKVRCFNYKS